MKPKPGLEMSIVYFSGRNREDIPKNKYSVWLINCGSVIRSYEVHCGQKGEKYRKIFSGLHKALILQPIRTKWPTICNQASVHQQPEYCFMIHLGSHNHAHCREQEKHDTEVKFCDVFFFNEFVNDLLWIFMCLILMNLLMPAVTNWVLIQKSTALWCLLELAQQCLWITFCSCKCWACCISWWLIHSAC